MSRTKRLTLLATLATLSWTTSVIAADESSASPSSPVASVATTTAAAPSTAAAPESTTTRRSPFASKPMTAPALAGKRGGDGSVVNDAQLKGVVANNQATNVATGSNVISDGAFAGSAGLSTVIQNSGNNVLIQNATIVNLQLK